MAVTYDATRAERELRRMTQATVDPGLTDPEIEDLLWLARIDDEDGYEPDDASWTPTYGHSGLRRAAAEGWRTKAGKLTPEFDAAVGSGTEFKRKQKYDMCMDMAAQFDRGAGGGIGSVALTTAGWIDA